MRKDIVIGGFIFVVIILFLGVLFYFKVGVHRNVVVKGTIGYVGNDYIIVRGEDNLDYYIDTDDDLNVGDGVKVSFKKVNRNGKLLRGKVIRLDVIKKTVHLPVDNNSVNNEGVSYRHTEDNRYYDDEDIVSYMENINSSLDEKSFDGDTIKREFVRIVDFLFYDGTIKGIKFSDLTSDTKLKVLKVFLFIDDKIEKYFPSYKDDIGYIKDNLEEKALGLYTNIISDICDKKESFCSDAREGFNQLKENLSHTWDFVKDVSNVGSSKIKNWYENWRMVS